MHYILDQTIRYFLQGFPNTLTLFGFFSSFVCRPLTDPHVMYQEMFTLCCIIKQLLS